MIFFKKRSQKQSWKWQLIPFQRVPFFGSIVYKFTVWKAFGNQCMYSIYNIFTSHFIQSKWC